MIVGSYPKGKSWVMCYGNKYEVKVEGIDLDGLDRFEKDPLYGNESPTLRRVPFGKSGSRAPGA